MTDLCAQCEVTPTTRKTYADVLKLDGVQTWVDGLQGNYCPRCKDYTISYEQAKANERLIAELRAAP